MGITVNFDSMWDMLGVQRKQAPGPALGGQAKGVLEALRPLLRPEDVQKLFRISRVETKQLSGRGGDVVSGKRGDQVVVAFNENAFGTHHPILWAALLVRELALTDRLVDDLPVTSDAKRQGVSRAIAFLNSLDARISLNFLESEIAKTSRKTVKSFPKGR